MKRPALAAVVLAAAMAACSSATSTAPRSSAAGDPPAPGTETPLQYLYFAARDTVAGCGDPAAKVSYGGSTAGYVVVAYGTFSCGHGGPGGITPKGTVLTMHGTIDRFGKFVTVDFGLGGETGPVPELKPLPAPPSGWKPPIPIAILRELIVRHAAGCGEAHPTGLAYAVTTQGAADRFSLIDYTIPGDRLPVYLVVAQGHFSCPHPGPRRPISSTMLMWMPADGSGLEPMRIITDNRTVAESAPLDGHLAPLP